MITVSILWCPQAHKLHPGHQRMVSILPPASDQRKDSRNNGKTKDVKQMDATVKQVHERAFEYFADEFR